MTMRKILTGLLGVAALGAVAVSATPAAAEWHHHHHYYRHHYYHPHYYRHYYRPYYYRPGVVIGTYPYYRRCWRAWRTVRVGWHWERRLVRVCR